MWYEAFSKGGEGNVVCRVGSVEFIIHVVYFVDPGEEGSHWLEGDLVLYTVPGQEVGHPA